jgi:uncharacterized membrane protein
MRAIISKHTTKSVICQLWQKVSMLQFIAVDLTIHPDRENHMLPPYTAPHFKAELLPLQAYYSQHAAANEH